MTKKKNKPVPLQERWATEKDDPIIIIKKAAPVEEVSPRAGKTPRKDEAVSKQ